MESSPQIEKISSSPHSVHWGINPLKNTIPVYFTKTPLKTFKLSKPRFLLNISFVIKYFRFQFIFYLKTTNLPPEKCHRLFSSNLIQKLRSCQAPSFLKIWYEVQHPSRMGGGGTHYVPTLIFYTHYCQPEFRFDLCLH